MSKKAKKNNIASYFEKLNEAYVCQIEDDGVICSEKLGLKVLNFCFIVINVKENIVQMYVNLCFKCTVLQLEPQ